MDEQKQILKLAAEIANTDLNELVEGWRRRLTIFDSQIRSFKELEDAYRQRLTEMDEAIDNLKALYRINMNFLGIVNAPAEAGDKDETDFTTRLTQ